MLGFITVPSVSDMIASTTAYATGMFDNLWPIAATIAGIIVGVLFVRLFIIKGLLKGVKKLTGRR